MPLILFFLISLVSASSTGCVRMNNFVSCSGLKLQDTTGMRVRRFYRKIYSPTWLPDGKFKYDYGLGPCGDEQVSTFDMGLMNLTIHTFNNGTSLLFDRIDSSVFKLFYDSETYRVSATIPSKISTWIAAPTNSSFRLNSTALLSTGAVIRSGKLALSLDFVMQNCTKCSKFKALQ